MPWEREICGQQPELRAMAGQATLVAVEEAGGTRGRGAAWSWQGTACPDLTATPCLPLVSPLLPSPPCRRREGRRPQRQASPLQGLRLPPVRRRAGAGAVRRRPAARVVARPRSHVTHPTPPPPCLVLPPQRHPPVHVPGRRLHRRQRHRRRVHLRREVCRRELPAQAHRPRRPLHGQRRPQHQRLPVLPLHRECGRLGGWAAGVCVRVCRVVQ